MSPYSVRGNTVSSGKVPLSERSSKGVHVLTVSTCLKKMANSIGRRAYTDGLGLYHDLLVARHVTSYFKPFRPDVTTEGGGDINLEHEEREEDGRRKAKNTEI